MWTQILAAFNGLPPAASSALTALASSLLTVLLGAIVLWRTNAGHDRRLKAQLAAAADLERVKRDAAAVEHKERLDAAAALEDKKLAAAAKDSERKLAAAAEETERKLQHAADEAHKQRLQTLRRDVFSDSVTALAKARVELSSMGGVDITEVSPASMVFEFAAAIDRLSLVADNASLEKIRRFGHFHAQILMGALPTLGELSNARAMVALHRKYREAAHDEGNRVIAAMAALREQGEIDRERMQALQLSFDTSQRQQRECFECEKQSLAEVNRLIAKLSRYVLAAQPAVTAHTDSVMLALRTELGIATEEGAFRALSASLQNAIAEQAQAALPQVFGEAAQSHTESAQTKTS